MPVGGIARGADWNPDQWPREIWMRDLELMAAAGTNLVTLPVFAWPLIEPADGEFDFEWLDDIMEHVHAVGIHVDLATATATPPAWLVRAWPEVLPVDLDGVRLEYGSRQSYCPNATAFTYRLERLTKRMAEHYRDHPALAMWHVSNEYGDHVARCYCSVCAQEFRTWLEHRYGDIARLNSAWGTAMWGQHYRDFAHIEPPRRTMAPSNPTHTLDFARFSTASIHDLYLREARILREETPQIPVTTNFMTMMTDVDYWRIAPDVDIISFDNYPDPADEFAHVTAALNYGIMRGLSDRQPWLLLESAASAVSWRPVNVPKRPGLNRLHGMQAVANGSDAVMYFQWRASRVGAERFHSAVIGHFGEESRTFKETAGLWQELATMDVLVGTQVRSSAAIVVDWEGRWAMDGPETMPSDRLRWIDQVRDWHRVLFGLGITVDAVRAGADLSGYALVVAPSMFVTTEADADNLQRFVESGGQLVVGPFSSVVDANNHVHAGGAPGPLSSLLGVSVEEPWPLSEPMTLASNACVTTVDVWAEWLHAVADVEVLASYESPPLAGRPAITIRRHGAGAACYVSARLAVADLVPYLRDAAGRAGIEVREQFDPGVESIVRTDGEHDFTFVLNHRGTEVRVLLPKTVTSVLLPDGHSDASGVVTLPPLGVLVFQSQAVTQGLVQTELVKVVS